MTILAGQRLPGERLANQHQSVVKKAPARPVYQAMKRALHNPPEKTLLKRDADRARAMWLGFERLAALGERHFKNYRVSRADHVRMLKEKDYLMERLQLLASDQLFDRSVEVEDAFDPKKHISQPQHMLNLRRLSNATFAGDYQPDEKAITELQTNLRKIAIGRYKGDRGDDLSLEFRGPINLLQGHVPLVRTVMDVTGDIDAIKVDPEADEPSEDWLRAAVSITEDRIVNNPARALATQIDGIEKSGEILIGSR